MTDMTEMTSRRLSAERARLYAAAETCHDCAAAQEDGSLWCYGHGTTAWLLTVAGNALAYRAAQRELDSMTDDDTGTPEWLSAVARHRDGLDGLDEALGTLLGYADND